MGVNVPSGYKQTKVGVIPEEWDVVKLGDIAPNISYGLTVRPKYIENGIPLISATEIKNGTIDYTNAPNISEDDFNKLSQKAKAKKGDIFLSKTGTVGRVAYVSIDKTIAITQNIAIIRTDGKKYSHEFLLQYLITDNFQKSAIKKVNQSTIMDLQLQDIKKLIIPLPPLKEQQKIAQILTTWDSAISRQEELIETKERLKKGLMQKLLGGEVQFAGFDGEWEEVRLGDVGKIVGGGTPDTTKIEYWGNDIFWFTPTEIKSKYIFESQRKISRLGLQKSSAKLLPKNTLLLTTRATIGDVGIAQKECTTNQGFQSIIVEDKNSYEYVYYWLLQNKKELLKRANGSTFIEISKKDIEKILFSKPSFLEQQKIAKVLTTADKEIALLKEELEALKEQKRGLMQRLLSGEVRTLKIEERE